MTFETNSCKWFKKYSSVQKIFSPCSFTFAVGSFIHKISLRVCFIFYLPRMVN